MKSKDIKNSGISYGVGSGTNSNSGSAIGIRKRIT
jgi:hypothetical protein